VCYEGGGRDSGSRKGRESDAQPHKARAAKRQPPVVPTAGGRPTGRSLVAQQMDDTNSERDEPALLKAETGARRATITFETGKTTQ
jgi:hypothetical protein